jgi:hypothetical protein
MRAKTPKGDRRVVGWMFDNAGHLIAWLQKPANHREPFAPNESTALRDTLRPSDVLLVEGKGRISGSIKYPTQSTWSHSALYVGPIAGAATDGEPHVLIESNIDEGVVSAPLSKYLNCQTRICRPVGLSEADCEKVCRYACERVGLGYDFKNVVDPMRYLFPWPLTQRWRRRTIALGSGDASRITCSSLIAQAFDAVRYPILPKITRVESQTAPREIAEIRHPSLYAPRDFNISPYFMVMKPTLARGFNYKDMHWADLPQTHRTGHARSRGRRRDRGGSLWLNSRTGRLSCATLTPFRYGHQYFVLDRARPRWRTPVVRALPLSVASRIRDGRSPGP